MNHIHRHFKKIILLSLLIPTVTFAAAFESYQVGSSPSNGYLLQTNGSVSTWVATSTLSDINYWLRSGSNLYYSSGNVGIGTTSPSAKLSVTGTSGSTANIFAIASSTNARLLTVTSAGNVGIGTTSPLSVLEVSGSPDILRLSGVSNPQLRFLTNSSNSSARSIFMAINQATLGDFVIRQSASNSSDPSTGTTRFQITPSGDISLNQSSGNVGIGTTSPTTNLSVTGNSVVTGSSAVGIAGFSGNSEKLRVYRSDAGVGETVRIEQGSTGDATLSFALTGVGAWMMGIDNSDGDVFKIGTSNADLGTSNKLTILRTGEVGIGTTSPLAKLDITGTAGSSDIFAISSSTNARLFTVSAAGNVGIGTNNPSGTLSVRTGGTVAGGTVYFDNFTCGAGYAGFSFNGDVPTSCGVYNFLSGTGDKNLYINRPSAKGIIFRENNATQGGWMPTTGNLSVGSTTGVAVSNKLSVYGNASIGATYENITAPTDGLIVKGNVGFGTTSPTTNLQVTTTSANATTTLTVGKALQNKGTCHEEYAIDGSVVYWWWTTTLTIASSTTSCK